MLDGGEVNTFGQLAYEFVEQVHDFRSALLQLVDDLHACEQALLLPLEPVDLLDRALQLVDLLGQSRITTLLSGNHLRIGEHRQHHHSHGCQYRAAHGHSEIALASFSFFLAPGE